MKKNLVKLLSAVCLAGGAVVALASCGSEKTIAIVKYMSHTSLNQIEDAIKEEITAESSDYKITTYDGNQDSGLIAQTLTTLKDKNTDVVVCIATPVATAAKTIFAGTDTKIVFAAVSDPVSAELLENLDAPEANITGTSDAIDLSKQLELVKAVNPDFKKIGYIYTGSEANSVANFNRLKTLATEQNFTLVDKQINNASEITEVFNAMKDDIDAIIVTDDNNVASAMNTLAPLCSTNHIPCYCAADSEIKDGGMMGYSIDYTTLGKDTGAMAVKLASGTAVKDVPVKVYSSSELALYYNSNFVSASGITIPSDLLSKATDLAK